MMGKFKQAEPKLFYHGFSLESRVPADHILRKVRQLVDFSFVRSQVEHLYGTNGHVSLDPAVILKLMFLLIYYNVKSELALMEQLPLRLDWLWFCGYDLDDPTPDHSVLSKARRRWGQETFSEFFALILGKCIDAGLVDGTIVHIDSSMIAANASKDSLKPQLRRIGQKLYNELDEQVSSNAADDEHHASTDNPAQDGDGNDRLERRVSTTDPDARLGSKKDGQSTLGYKDHRVVDDKRGIVTATVTTPANINDSEVFVEAVETHQSDTDTQIKTAVADKIYGTIDNYKYLKEHHATACIAHQRHSNSTGKLSSDQFTYDKQQDCFICPAGQKLMRHSRKQEEQSWRYRADRAVCEQCKLFDRCVSSPTQGRQVQRADGACYIEWADACLSKSRRKYLMARRKYKVEGSFADAANNHGFKRARWRGIVAMTIQNVMIAAIQNLRKLMRALRKKTEAKAEKLADLSNFHSQAALFTTLRRPLTSVCERILTFIKSNISKKYFSPVGSFWATCP